MTSNIFGRYVWQIDTLRRYKKLTFEEIFGVYIECNIKNGYK